MRRGASPAAQSRRREQGSVPLEGLGHRGRCGCVEARIVAARLALPRDGGQRAPCDAGLAECPPPRWRRGVRPPISHPPVCEIGGPLLNVRPPISHPVNVRPPISHPLGPLFHTPLPPPYFTGASARRPCPSSRHCRRASVRRAGGRRRGGRRRAGWRRSRDADRLGLRR